MSPFPQLTLVLRSQEPQETFVRICAGLDADALWQDAALPTRADVCVYSAFPLDLKELDGPM